MIAANSKIFTNTIFGLSSNDTSANLTATNVQTQETYLGYSTASNLRTQVPKIPSNQRIAKDK